MQVLGDRYKLMIGPAAEPISAQDAQQFGWDFADEDLGILAKFITEVRQRFEGLSGLCLVTQTWKVFLDRWPCRVLELRRAPLIAVSSIQYAYPTTGVMTTWSAANYQVDANDIPGRIWPVWGQTWPTYYDQMAPIAITFTAGFGAASAVPMKIKMRLAQAVKYRYDHRDDFDFEWLDRFLGGDWHGWTF